VIEAFITNRGKYVEGDLCGEWLKFPASTEQVKALLSKIGVDGVLYEEYFITSFNDDPACRCLGEYDGIDEINYLAALISELEDYELVKFNASAAKSDSFNAKDLLNLIHNQECYDFIPDVSDDDELGRYVAEELSAVKIPEWIENYFDYEAYGRDFGFNTNGIFTQGGFVYHNRGEAAENYKGRDDIPEEYRIFAYPDPPEKMPIKARLEMYGKMVSEPRAAGKAAPDRESP